MAAARGVELAHTLPELTEQQARKVVRAFIESSPVRDHPFEQRRGAGVVNRQAPG